jgi:hypothetical protein
MVDKKYFVSCTCTSGLDVGMENEWTVDCMVKTLCSENKGFLSAFLMQF